MAADTDESSETPAPEAEPRPVAPPPARPRRRWKRWLFGTAGIILLFPIIALALWTWITLSWSYSEGERSGYIQKFSKKGWLCKTWEGELAQATIPGTLTEKFYFTVRDDSIAAVIDSLNRTWDGRVSVHYEQHRGVPFRCFGETEYFVDRVSAVSPTTGRPSIPAPTTTTPTPAPTTPPGAPPTPR